MRKSVFTAAILTALISGETFAAPTLVWTKVADEYQSFSTSGNRTVRFGANSSWVQKTFTGTITPSCSISTFGSDPAVGATKVCQMLMAQTKTSSSTTTTTTTPISYKANISWTIPITRVDGTPLLASQLSGYEVYYTNDSGSVKVTVPISGGSTVNTVVSSLASGNYYFSISAIDTGGVKSALSTVASVSFP